MVEKKGYELFKSRFKDVGWEIGTGAVLMTVVVVMYLIVDYIPEDVIHTITIVAVVFIGVFGLAVVSAALYLTYWLFISPFVGRNKN